jgi:hypothetical protein
VPVGPGFKFRNSTGEFEVAGVSKYMNEETYEVRYASGVNWRYNQIHKWPRDYMRQLINADFLIF